MIRKPLNKLNLKSFIFKRTLKLLVGTRIFKQLYGLNRDLQALNRIIALFV